MKTKQTQAKLPEFDCDTFYNLTDEDALRISREYMKEALIGACILASKRLDKSYPVHSRCLRELYALQHEMLQEKIDSSLINQMINLASQTKRYLELLKVVIVKEEVRRLN